VPTLVLGSMLVRLLGPSAAPGLRLGDLSRPLSYVVEPVRWAYAHDADLFLLAWVVVQALLLALVWGLFAGAIYRLAAVDLAKRRREEGREAFAFARRHWRGLVGARLALWAAVLVPLVLAVGVATVGRLPGWLGTALLAVAALFVLALVIGAVLAASVNLAGGFLVGPTVACEDSDAFDAASRTITYTSSSLPRVVGVRLLFASGALLGSLYRLVRTLVVALLAWACLRIGAGEGALDRALTILAAMGPPPDAARLGLEAADYALAAALAVLGAGLFAAWAADGVSRVLTARVAAYLVLRRAIDAVPADVLRTVQRDRGHRSAEEAGFVEVARVEG
jgi:hypothetical protein